MVGGAGRQLHGKTIKLTAKGSFTPLSKPPVVATQTFTLGTSAPVGITHGSG
jgi:hypothetical protein